MSKCSTCEGTGWDFKGKPPPYPPCKDCDNPYRKDKKNDDT